MSRTLLSMYQRIWGRKAWNELLWILWSKVRGQNFEVSEDKIWKGWKLKLLWRKHHLGHNKSPRFYYLACVIWPAIHVSSKDTYGNKYTTIGGNKYFDERTMLIVMCFKSPFFNLIAIPSLYHASSRVFYHVL